MEDLNTYFYADGADRENIGAFLAAGEPVNLGAVQISGFVTSIDPYDGTFAIDTGLDVVDVSTDQLGYNPVEEDGVQQIEEGDYVTTSGDFSRALLDQRQLQAQTLATLDDNS